MSLMRYKVFQRTKIYQGNFELRDYEWEKLLQRGMGARLELGTFDENKVFQATHFMTVPLAELRKMKISGTVQGNISYMQYRMRAIKWKPELIIKEPVVEIDQNVRAKLGDMFRKKQNI